MAYNVLSSEALSRVIRAGDSRRFGVNLKKDRSAILSGAADEALRTAPQLAPFMSTKIRGKLCVSYQRYNDHLIIRSIARYLRRRLRISVPDRHKTSIGVIQALADSTPMYLLRRDISSFYESLDVEKIKDRVLYDTTTAPRVRAYLRHFFDQHCAQSGAGIPRGIGLSALLSELYMQDFDKRVRELPGVYRYFRYADDILIFSTVPNRELDPALLRCLPNGMRFNSRKAANLALGEASRTTKPVHFEYLGYRYNIATSSKKESARTISLGIAKTKISRLKSRVILTTKEFGRTGDFSLFYDRMRFLTSNYEVRRNGVAYSGAATHVRSGIYYSYLHCGTYTVSPSRAITKAEWDAHELRSLDGFFRAIAFGASSRLAAQIRPRLSALQITLLKELSFHAGYQSRMMVRLQPHEVADIKAVWRHV